MYRITVACLGISPDDWPDAISDVNSEFADRLHHRIMSVNWLGADLVVVAENDYDSDGEAFADEYSDTVAAYAPGTPGYSIRIVSVVPVENGAA